MLFLRLMLLVTGITEFHEKRKVTAITLFFVTGFNFTFHLIYYLANWFNI
ncbi:DUF3953 domain-containing protein [Oceanobacillus sp. 143]|nr:DUF3953 domain-containing protein [Oceanobacillus sp. 143]